MSIFKGKKNKVGIQPKARLKSVVNAEYNEQAARLGHAARMIREMEFETKKLEAEIEERMNEMRRLDFEMKQALPDPEQKASAAGEDIELPATKEGNA